MKNVVLFLADGVEEVEAITVIDILRRGDVEIKTMSISKSLIVEGSHKVNIKADLLFDKEIAENADMIILPGGGVGTDNLKKHKELNEVVEYFVKNNKYTAAICAAPTVLGVKGLLTGKKAVCYPGLEEQLKQAEIGNDNVVIDGKIITSKGPGTAMEFALKILEILKGTEVCESVKSGLLL